MRGLLIIVLAAGLLGLGCNSTGKKPPAPTNLSGQKGATPFWSEDPPPKNHTAIGEAPRTTTDGLLAGMLIDSGGRPQPNALVNVTPADGGPNAKPIGIQADDQGYFMIRGLKTGTTYFLSVRGENGGRVLGGSAMTEAPNTRLLIKLSEGNVSSVTPPPQPHPSPSGPPAAPEKKDNKPKLADPPTTNIPHPEPIPASRDPLTESDQSWSPGKKPPVSRPLPPPPPPAVNPNIAEGNHRPWPPTVTIPSPAPKSEAPPPPPSSPSMSAVPSNSSPLTGGPVPQQTVQRINFTVYDANGNPVEFRNLTDRRLIVVDFWTTTCMPCLRKIPDLIDLQSRYGSYVEVAGIACDDLPFAQRKKAVEGIKDYYLHKAQRPINYGIWFEGEKQEGRVQNQFRVKAYPTMILLDYTGHELWRGSDVRQLEESIKYYLMRK